MRSALSRRRAKGNRYSAAYSSATGAFQSLFLRLVLVLLLVLKSQVVKRGATIEDEDEEEDEDDFGTLLGRRSRGKGQP